MLCNNNWWSEHLKYLKNSTENFVNIHHTGLAKIYTSHFILTYYWRRGQHLFYRKRVNSYLDANCRIVIETKAGKQRVRNLWHIIPNNSCNTEIIPTRPIQLDRSSRKRECRPPHILSSIQYTRQMRQAIEPCQNETLTTSFWDPKSSSCYFNKIEAPGSGIQYFWAPSSLIKKMRSIHSTSRESADSHSYQSNIQ